MKTTAPIIEIVRLENNVDHGTFGVLKLNKRLFCLTLEPPWRNNLTDVSCIPAGQYICHRFRSVKFGATFRIKNVFNRFNIEFHYGNTVKDTRGCPLLGFQIGELYGVPAILKSKLAFNRFIDLVSDQLYLHLTIKEDY